MLKGVLYSVSTVIYVFVFVILIAMNEVAIKIRFFFLLITNKVIIVQL